MKNRILKNLSSRWKKKPKNLKETLEEHLSAEEIRECEELTKEAQELAEEPIIRGVAHSMDISYQMMNAFNAEQEANLNIMSSLLTSSLLFLRKEDFITIPSLKQEKNPQASKEDFFKACLKARKMIVEEVVDSDITKLIFTGEEQYPKKIKTFLQDDEAFANVLSLADIMHGRSIASPKEASTLISFIAFAMASFEEAGVCKMTLKGRPQKTKKIVKKVVKTPAKKVKPVKKK